MSVSRDEEVEKTLRGADLHREWETRYRTTQNARFFDMAFRHILSALNAPSCAKWLDAGCGACSHSIRLAAGGFFVVAVDFSESVLEMAEENLRASGLGERIALRRENILSLSFPDETFDSVSCWGVLMHIPDLEKAISELARVLKRGGTIVISEGNMYSLQSLLIRALRKLRGNPKHKTQRTPAGSDLPQCSDGQRPAPNCNRTLI
jgi:2-polyprenyl-3-methyl-5-hydroxy-6-metoxy-1,4-benzoquinol methylase